MDAATTQELTSYRANCHCGDVTFTVTLPSLTDHEVMSCNCSICARNGYLFVYPELKNMLFHSGYDHLKSYSFGAKRIAHKFCPICGSSIIETDHSGGKQFMGVNVGMDQYMIWVFTLTITIQTRSACSRISMSKG